MRLFRDKKVYTGETPTSHVAAVEIVAHQNATAEAKKEVDKANKLLENIFKDNHFSLTMYIAAGGKVKQKRSAH